MRILAYCCQWGGYTSADQAGKLRITLPAALRVAEVRCVGQVEPAAMLEPFLYQVHGVLLVGCQRGGCHYITGNIHAQERVNCAHRLLELCGVDTRRLHCVWLDAADGEGFAREVEGFLRTVAPMGDPVPDSETALSLKAACAACHAEKLRWLAGTGYDLKKTGNVFGRVLSAEEYRIILDEVIKDAFLRARLVLLLAQSPRTTRELALATREDLARVSATLTLLEREGKVRHHSVDNGFPRFIADAVP